MEQGWGGGGGGGGGRAGGRVVNSVSIISNTFYTRNELCKPYLVSITPEISVTFMILVSGIYVTITQMVQCVIRVSCRLWLIIFLLPTLLS